MIETERLIIREMTVEDYSSLYNIFSDPTTMKFWQKPFDSEQVERWIHKNLILYKEHGYGRWIIELKHNNQVIGDAGFLLIEIDGKLENDLGYIIYSKYWGNEYGIEVAKACLEYGFEQLNMKRIIANMPHNHYASIKVAQRIGMLKEKEFYNKRNRDILTYLYSKEI